MYKQVRLTVSKNQMYVISDSDSPMELPKVIANPEQIGFIKHRPEKAEYYSPIESVPEVPYWIINHDSGKCLMAFEEDGVTPILKEGKVILRMPTGTGNEFIEDAEIVEDKPQPLLTRAQVGKMEQEYITNLVDLLNKDPFATEQTKQYAAIDSRLEGYLWELWSKDRSILGGLITALELRLDK